MLQFIFRGVIQFILCKMILSRLHISGSCLLGISDMKRQKMRLLNYIFVTKNESVVMWMDDQIEALIKARSMTTHK